MNKIGIIAGAGDLPIFIGDSLINKNYNICFFCIKNFAINKNYNRFNYKEINLTSFSNILNSLKEEE